MSWKSLNSRESSCLDIFLGCSGPAGPPWDNFIQTCHTWKIYFHCRFLDTVIFFLLIFPDRFEIIIISKQFIYWSSNNPVRRVNIAKMGLKCQQSMQWQDKSLSMTKWFVTRSVQLVQTQELVFAWPSVRFIIIICSLVNYNFLIGSTSSWYTSQGITRPGGGLLWWFRILIN